MGSENKRQKDKQPVKQKKKRTLPQEDTFGPKPDYTSMSSGNLVNNPYGRTRTRDLHTKNSVTAVMMTDRLIDAFKKNKKGLFI